MSEPEVVSLPADEAGRLHDEREGEAAAAGAGEGKGKAAAAGDEGADEGAPSASRDELLALLELLEALTGALGAAPVSPAIKAVWTESASRCARKYGGRLPYLDELVLLGTSLAIGAHYRAEFARLDRESSGRVVDATAVSVS